MGEKIDGYEFWRQILNSPRYILAPMVEQSELPWRLLSRRYGAKLCYTPMLHASIFMKDAKYRKENFTACSEDRPLIAQFCANKVETFVEAAKLIQDDCDAIDLNIGCPQTIAQRGHYGAFLEEEWDLLRAMISAADSELKVPITCKIRIFNDIERTVQYAKMLESAGCKLLAVHGRTKEQKGAMTGLASWEHIKAVKDNVTIPVIANGNILCLEDVEECIRITNADGVMTAEGNLHNPALFAGIQLPVYQIALEYLQLVLQYPCPMSCIRGHLFKVCHYCLVLPDNHDLRQRLASARCFDDFFSVVEDLKMRYEKKNSTLSSDSQKDHLEWICQPYIRRESKADTNPVGTSQKREASPNVDGCVLSKQKLKKLMKQARKKIVEKIIFEQCAACRNSKGQKCCFNLCKTCCKLKTSKEQLDCSGHRFLFNSKSKDRETVVN